MSLKDYLNLDACVFNPIRYYDGEFVFPFLDVNFKYSPLLMANAKVENGKNLFISFAQKYYLTPLAQFKGTKAGQIMPYIIINKGENEKRKSAKFYIFAYIMDSFLSMTSTSLEKKYKIFEMPNMDKVKIYYRNILNEQLQKYLLLKKNIDNPRYTELKEFINYDYKYYLRRINSSISFELFISTRIKELQHEIRNIDKIFKFFEQKIDVNKFIECFDFDTLALFLAYSSVYQCEQHLTDFSDKVDYCLEFCEYYFLAVDELMKDTKEDYNPSIIIDVDTRKTIDLKTVRARHKKIKDEHPEYVLVSFDEEGFNRLFKDANKAVKEIDISTEDGAKVVDNAIRDLLEQKALKASWKIIPKGQSKERAKKIIDAIRSEITDEEAARRVEYCYKFFEYNADINDTNARRCKHKYLYSLQGVGGFEGYTAYIYSTGKVVFEIFFEDEKTFKPVKYHATYVTDLYHFIELSKLTKQEITLKLKKDSRLGRKYYHRQDMDKWANEIENGIGTIEYSEDVIAYINSLLKSGELSASTIKTK